MRDIIHPTQIYPALQALLGLPDHSISFELRVGIGQFGVIVACEHYVALDAPGLKQLESVLSEYELVQRKPVEQPQPAKVEDFDVWMRERTDRAHAEYMARHAAGGIDYNKKWATGGVIDLGMRLVGGERMSAADHDRWVFLVIQILSMQRDIAQRKVHGPGTTKFR